MKRDESLSAIVAIGTHLDWFIEQAPARGYGPDDTAMWISSVDLQTGRHPDPGARPEGIEKRCYRWIEAPMGCNPYWDQPLLAAAWCFSEITGETKYRKAVIAALGDFLDRCVAASGLFLWGNHYYYDATEGKVVAFTGHQPPHPVDPAVVQGELHETRPLPVAWHLFIEIAPETSKRAVRAQAERHVTDRDTGEFNRHADRKRGHAFLEAGGILAVSLCRFAYLHADSDLAERALRIAQFSFNNRDPNTRLISNSPTTDRWDVYMCTSEAGMWAGCLQVCAELTRDERFNAMAEEVLEAWLAYAWDEDRESFCGKLLIDGGRPVFGEKVTLYQPGDYCDLWEPLFPAHDYPFPCAEACLRAWERTRRECFRIGVERWVRMIENHLPARSGRGAYAEHYGRCIHFLDRAAQVFERQEWRELADRVETEAFRMLYTAERFRTHPGEDRCDAVDGLGFLFLSLLERHVGDFPAACRMLHW